MPDDTQPPPSPPSAPKDEPLIVQAFRRTVRGFVALDADSATPFGSTQPHPSDTADDPLTPLLRYLATVRLAIDAFHGQVAMERTRLSHVDQARLCAFAANLGARLIATVHASHVAIDRWRAGSLPDEALLRLLALPWAIFEQALDNPNAHASISNGQS
jgi:hypothetical protein